MAEPLGRLKTALEGRYTLERELGAGSMATVYLAHDLKHDRKVALKVLKPELAAVVGANRFLAEIRTTANLPASHILPLLDSGEAGGFLYFVMPYVEGESLRDRLDRVGELPVDEAARIASAARAREASAGTVPETTRLEGTMNRWMATMLPLILLLACQAPPPQADAPPANPLDGAWSLVALQEVAPDGTITVFTPRESLLLFSGRYYSMAYVVGDEPAAYYAERFNPTDEESLARINSMTVNAGTYEIEGSRVTMRPLVARVPEFVGGRAEHEFAVSGDTLTLHWNLTVSADGVENPAGVEQLTLVRLR